MAVAGWLAWRDSGVSVWIAIFRVQLALNAAWTLIFFGRRRLGLAAVEIASLWVAVVATRVGFWTVNPVAGLLLVPYLVWVTLADLLNIAIWRLNQPAA